MNENMQSMQASEGHALLHDRIEARVRAESAADLSKVQALLDAQMQLSETIERRVRRECAAEIAQLAKINEMFGEELFGFQERFGVASALTQEISDSWDKKYCLRAESAAEIRELRAALAQCVEALHRSAERMVFAEPWSAAEIDIEFAQKAIDNARSVLGGE